METPPVRLTRADIRRLLEMLNAELAAEEVEGEIHMVGGAVMCLALNARDAAQDIEAFFRPARAIRQAAARVAARAELPESWLNDAVKGFLSPRGTYDPFIELSHLRVYVARPEYLLAMKAVAMRLGEEFHDLDDVRFLLRYLNITTLDDAMAIVLRYFDAEHVRPKTRFALEELLRCHRAPQPVAGNDELTGCQTDQILFPYVAYNRRTRPPPSRRPACRGRREHRLRDPSARP
jgi:hypothetical protein